MEKIFRLLPTHKEYYYVKSMQEPLIEASPNCPLILCSDQPAELDTTLTFDVIDIPQVKEIDYLKSIDGDSIIGDVIFDVLNALNIDGIQLLKSCLYLNNVEYSNNYWAIHIYKHLKCIDVENTEADIYPEIDVIYDGKIVIDIDVISKIPLKERLIFRFEESNIIQVFHESIVEKIMAVNPIGVEFISLLEYKLSSH